MQHLTDYYILYLLLICRIFLKYGTGNVMNNSMRQRLSFMRRMGLSYQRELYVCIANDLGMRKSRL